MTTQDFRKCVFLVAGYKCIAFGEPTGRIGKDCKFGRMDNMSDCGCSGVLMDQRMYTQDQADELNKEINRLGNIISKAIKVLEEA